MLWACRRGSNIYANLSPGGIIGIFTGWGLALGAIPLIENNLTQGQLFSQPSFQSLPIYTGVGMGTIAVLLWLRRRLSSSIATALAILIAVNAAAWFFTIIPSVKGRWLIVGPGAAHVLSDAYYGTSHSTQVVSSQGVVGRFGAFALSNFFVRGIALRSEPITVLFTPYDGINTLDVNADFANLAVPWSAKERGSSNRIAARGGCSSTHRSAIRTWRCRSNRRSSKRG